MLGLASLSASAIGPDIFNKLGVGVGVGTGGVSFEAATPITPFVQMPSRCDMDAGCLI